MSIHLKLTSPASHRNVCVQLQSHLGRRSTFPHSKGHIRYQMHCRRSSRNQQDRYSCCSRWHLHQGVSPCLYWPIHIICTKACREGSLRALITSRRSCRRDGANSVIQVESNAPSPMQCIARAAIRSRYRGITGFTRKSVISTTVTAATTQHDDSCAGTKVV